MFKYIALSSLFFVGCSTVSEYRRGCMDGMVEFGDELSEAYNEKLNVDKDRLSSYCEKVEKLNKRHEREVLKH